MDDVSMLRRRITELETETELNGIRIEGLETDIMRWSALTGMTLGCALGALVVVMLAVVL